jgi:hypothetical protein
LVAAGGLLLAVLIAQHYALDREPEVRQRALLVLALIGYLLAFGVFSAVYFERFRTLYSAALIGGSGTLLAYANLRWTQRGGLLPIAVFVGLLLGEVTWGLNYWPAPFLLGGALLLLVFYVSVSLIAHYLSGTLQRRVVIEYALLGGGLFAAVVYATFS